MGKPVVFTAEGERQIHNAGFPLIATGYKDGVNDDDLATVGQVRNSSQSFLYMQATTLFRVEKVASLTWILTAVDELGAPITAIVPATI